MRDTPRDLEDAMTFDRTPQFANVLSTDPDAPSVDSDRARRIARECYSASTDWINASRRQKWAYSLRAFQNLHATDSKYLSADYRYRSRTYRPKSRTMVRKAEADTAYAFFANADVVNIEPQDDNNPQQLASAEINMQLLNYRLKNTIPWFLTVVGARQDAEVMGICIGKAYWKYQEKLVKTEHRLNTDPTTGQIKMDEQGLPIRDAYDIYEKTIDHPWIDLIAAENFRFDPGADWRNPVATSPYLIELIPMYIADMRAKVESGEWNNVGESNIFSSVNLDDDATRRAREVGRVPGKDNDAGRPRDYEIGWIRENIIRIDSQDWHFLTISGSGELLTEPKILSEVYLQGVRPYVCGFIIPEAHKTHPTSKVELVKDLQQTTNETANLRLDNVKLTLNPRQFVRTGKNVDVQDIRIFNPGKVVLMQDPTQDIVWDRPPEVTQSSYAEQDRINLDFDDLAGGQSNASIQANPQMYQAVGNTELMDQNANKLGEYELRVFAETFVEPILRQMVKLEQAYETDEVILAIAGREAQLYQKFGISEITDELLREELTVKVNVGVGATNPQIRLKNFDTAVELVGKVFGPAAAQGADFAEVTKEVFSLCGYKDGSRFFKPGFDPQAAMQQMAASKNKPHAAAPAAPPDPSKTQVAQINADAKIKDRQMQVDSAQHLAQMDLQQTAIEEAAQTERQHTQMKHDLLTAVAQHAIKSRQQPIMMGRSNV